MKVDTEHEGRLFEPCRLKTSKLGFDVKGSKHLEMSEKHRNAAKPRGVRKSARGEPWHS
jgi:hypothetical protein